MAGSSALADLSPILENDLVKVGGRLGDSESDVVKHPIILPKHFITLLIVRQCHENVGHLGTISCKEKISFAERSSSG